MYDASVELVELLGDDVLELDVRLCAVELELLLLSLNPADDDEDFELELEVRLCAVELELIPRELRLLELADDFELLLELLRLDGELGLDADDWPSDEDDEDADSLVEDDELLPEELEDSSDWEDDGIYHAPFLNFTTPMPQRASTGMDSSIRSKLSPAVLILLHANPTVEFCKMMS